MRLWPWSKPKPRVRKLREPVERHLAIDLAEAESVTHSIKPIEQVNLQQVVDRWCADSAPPAQILGYSSTGYSSDDGVSKHLMMDELIQAPVERVRIEPGGDLSWDCTRRGLFLLYRDKVPLVLAFSQGRFSSDLPMLEVIAASREVARDTLAVLLREAQRDSVYRGRAISLEASGNWREEFSIRFQELRSTPRDQIVLSEEILQVVERNVLGMLKHAGALRAAKRSLRRGLLFHGPPGTGKTMTVRYLAEACRDHTVILLTGDQQGMIREACQVARLLAPSIVVLEDVDLVAEDRDQNRYPFQLHTLLNEMDGLGERDEVAFLLTTNRPEILEPALSARPGRIDQAIAFPLPDEKCRRKLFEVYGQGLDLSGIDVGRWVGQTDGVSPAFIEELIRKAVLMAAERGEESQPMRILDADFNQAMKELVYFGGELTQKLLGYRTGRIGYGPRDGN